jgi:endonuclease V-like protein UPF0215 family
MRIPARPHVLGIDDGPFRKRQREPVPIVGVTMEGADLVEGVAVTAFPVDGDGATEFLARWVMGLRARAGLHGLVLGGITLAGLGIVEIPRLAERVERPVLAVGRRSSRRSELARALRAAGLEERLPLLERTPAAFRVADGLWVSAAGIAREGAAALVRATLRKARVPEPLRLAHLLARGLVLGESRGRV